MSRGIVFKQSYSSRTKVETPGLNARNLHYIATRPGAVYNPGCGFGLWGRLPEDATAHTQNDLRHAESVIRDVSQRRTVYRAILSVDKDTAEEHSLYHREAWQDGLIANQISAIAKAMDIKAENFCYLASMHCEKGHPHVHLQYWDNGVEPRNEAIPKAKFAIISERVRAAFNREIYGEEISQAQKAQKDDAAQLRNELRALLLEANPEQGVSLAKLYRSPKLPPLAEKLMEIVVNVPSTGSLRYAYLPLPLREKVDALVKAYLELPELSKLYAQHEAVTVQISELYGNGENAISHNLQKTQDKLHRELANEILKAVRTIRNEMGHDEPVAIPELQALLLERGPYLRSLPTYRELLELLPTDRIPWPEIKDQVPEYNTLANKLVSDVLSEWRTTGLIQSCIQAEGQRRGIDPRDKAAMTALRTEIWRTAASTLHRYVRSALYQDTGWKQEAAMTHSAHLAAAWISLLSRMVGQRKAAAAMHREKQLASRDESQAAKKDRRVQEASESGWQE